MNEISSVPGFPEQQTALGMSQSINEIAPALVAAQGAMISPRRNRKVVVKSRTGQSYNFSYSTLDSINDMIREPLARNGLCLIQQVRLTKPATLVTRLLHSSGQWIETVMPLSPAEAGPQAMGSAITYGRRYSIVSLLNIASDEDDDGAAAGGHNSRPVEQDEPKQGRSSEAKVEHVLAERFRRLISTARALKEGDLPAGVTLLKAWQRDMGEFTDIRTQPGRAEAWATLVSDMPSALKRAFGATAAQAWVDALEAQTAEAMQAVRARWDGVWAPNLVELKKVSSAAYGLLAEHMRAQDSRVDKMEVKQTEEAETPPPPAEPGPTEVQGFVAHLLDEHGERVSEQVYTSRLEFARAYANMMLGTGDPEALEGNNVDALAECMDDTEASAVLADLSEPQVSVKIEAVQVPRNRGGNPDLAAYLKLVRDAILGLDRTSLEPWEAANSPIYSALPNGTKLQVLKALSERRRTLGMEAA